MRVGKTSDEPAAAKVDDTISLWRIVDLADPGDMPVLDQQTVSLRAVFSAVDLAASQQY
jgi:hypothetical protein